MSRSQKGLVRMLGAMSPTKFRRGHTWKHDAGRGCLNYFFYVPFRDAPNMMLAGKRQISPSFHCPLSSPPRKCCWHGKQHSCLACGRALCQDHDWDLRASDMLVHAAKIAATTPRRLQLQAFFAPIWCEANSVAGPFLAPPAWIILAPTPQGTTG